MKGKRDVTIELLKNATEIYNVNPQYIFTGMGNMFMDDDPSHHPSIAPVSVSEEKIIYVPTSAHAGYTDQYNDPVFLEDLVSFFHYPIINFNTALTGVLILSEIVWSLPCMQEIKWFALLLTIIIFIVLQEITLSMS